MDILGPRTPSYGVRFCPHVNCRNEEFGEWAHGNTWARLGPQGRRMCAQLAPIPFPERSMLDNPGAGRWFAGAFVSRVEYEG